MNNKIQFYARRWYSTGEIFNVQGCAYKVVHCALDAGGMYKVKAEALPQ